MPLALALSFLPLLKYHKNCQDNKTETNEMVPGQFFVFEKYSGKDDKHGKRYGLLYGFKLNKAKGATGFFRAGAVSRYLE
jgi:hypothetical protein